MHMSFNAHAMKARTKMLWQCYPSLTLSTAKPRIEEEWLEVPWKHIANIRIATEAGEYGRCAAFDIQASPSEKSSFFMAVGVPRDRGEQLSTTVFAAFDGWPPSPARVVQKLQRLSLGSEVYPSIERTSPGKPGAASHL